MSTPEATAAAPEPMLTLRPPSRWPGLGLGELWQYRELLYFLAKREVQIRYKQSLLGVSWAILQPVGMAFIFALFFGSLLDLPSQGIPWAVFALVGIVPWTFAAQTINNGAQSLVIDSVLLTRVYFPRLAIPIAKGLGLMLDLGIAMVVTLIFVLAYGLGLTWLALLAPLFVLLSVVTSFAMATLFAAVNVRYRDMIVVVPITVQLLLFLSPLIYPAELITGAWQYVYAINPCSSVITGLRWCLADGPAPGGIEVLISVASAATLLVAALVYFRRSEQTFADVI
jgi:lipopolysaccharide transport system permease protein